MLRIKLSPVGKKHARHFRLSVMENRSKLNGAVRAVIGHVKPGFSDPKVDAAALSLWLSRGAQPSASVRRLLKL